MTITTIDTRDPYKAKGYTPIFRSSFDKVAEQRLDYEVIADDAILSGAKKPKGIILQTYSAIDNASISAGELATQGYLVCFVHGHTLAEQVKAGGARSTIRDMTYFASLIGEKKTRQRRIQLLDKEITQLKDGAKLGSDKEIAVRQRQADITALQSSRLTDSRGNSPLAGLRFDDDVPVIMNGHSQGGELTLDIASNLEPFDCHYGLKATTGHVTPTTFFNQRYDDPFDAFAAECPWFRKEEYMLYSSCTPQVQSKFGTTASKSRAVGEQYIEIHSPTMSDAQKEKNWLAAVAAKTKGMAHLGSAFPLDPMANVHNIRKPVLLLQSQRDDNTPTLFTAQFAKKLLDTTGVYVDQHYYGTNQVEHTTLHRYPAVYNQRYNWAIDNFVTGFKQVRGQDVVRTATDYQAAAQLEQRAAWNQHDMAADWGDISTLNTVRQVKPKQQQGRWEHITSQQINSIYQTIIEQGRGHLLYPSEGPYKLQQALLLLGISITLEDIQGNEVGGADKIFLTQSQYQHILQIHKTIHKPNWGHIRTAMAESIYEKVTEVGQGQLIANLSNHHAPYKMTKALEILGFNISPGDVIGRASKDGYNLWMSLAEFRKVESLHQEMRLKKQQTTQQPFMLDKNNNRVVAIEQQSNGVFKVIAKNLNEQERSICVQPNGQIVGFDGYAPSGYVATKIAANIKQVFAHFKLSLPGDSATPLKVDSKKHFKYQVPLPYDQAKAKVQAFKSFIYTAGLNYLVYSSGYIKGLTISKTKGPAKSNLKITDPTVYEAFQRFEKYLLIKQHCDVLSSELNGHIVMNKQRKQTKYNAMKGLMDKLLEPDGGITQNDIDSLRNQSGVTAGIFSGGFFKNRTDNILNKMSEMLTEEEQAINPVIHKV